MGLTCRTQRWQQTRARSGRSRDLVGSSSEGETGEKSHMKRIKISIQPVQRSLRARSLFLNDNIGLACRGLVRSRSRPSVCLSPKKDPRKAEEPPGQPREPLIKVFPDHRQRTFTHTLATESTRPPDKERRLVLKDDGTSFLVLCYHLRRYRCGRALVEDFENPAPQ